MGWSSQRSDKNGTVSVFIKVEKPGEGQELKNNI